MLERSDDYYPLLYRYYSLVMQSSRTCIRSRPPKRTWVHWHFCARCQRRYVGTTELPKLAYPSHATKLEQFRTKFNFVGFPPHFHKRGSPYFISFDQGFLHKMYRRSSMSKTGILFSRQQIGTISHQIQFCGISTPFSQTGSPYLISFDQEVSSQDVGVPLSLKSAYSSHANKLEQFRIIFNFVGFPPHFHKKKSPYFIIFDQGFLLKT